MIDSPHGAAVTQNASLSEVVIAVKVLPTVGVIARGERVPLHRVEYVISSRGIQPEGMAGNARVFSDAAVARIKSELQRIDDDREGIPVE